MYLVVGRTFGFLSRQGKEIQQSGAGKGGGVSIQGRSQCKVYGRYDVMAMELAVAWLGSKG